MSRRPVPANAGSVVSLFPFLAVLLCTIGALILLLVIIARHSAEQARLEAERARAAPAVDLAAVAQEQEDLDWQVEQLSGSWEKTSQVLVDQRAHLSHLEEHAQRLRTEISQWEEAQRQLADRQSLDAAAQEKLRAEIEELKRRAAEAEAKLTEVKGRVKRTAFAVVPYDGANGTRRRPIYIECRGDAIVLQPEGIVFTENDFAGSLGPSNPLAACVRATAEHYARAGNLEPGEQAYPLLLVRPNGISAYYVARAAMTSWDSEFGYELVDADWSLDFPASDPRLKQLLAAVQQEARERQVMIARAAPSLRPSERLTFGDAGGDGSGDSDSGMLGSGGGIAAGGGVGGGIGQGGNGQAGGGAIDAPYVAPRGHLAESAANTLPGGSFGGQGGGVGGLPGGPGGGYGTNGGGPGGPQLGQPGGAGMYPGGNGTGSGAAGGGNGSYAQGGANGGGNSSTSGTGNGGSGVAGATGSGGSASSADGMTAGGSPGQSGFAQSGSAGGGSGGSGDSFGGAGSSGGGGAGSGGGGSSGGGDAGASASTPDGGPQTLSMTNRSQSGGEAVDSLAKKRGKDWSLPDAARKKTPVSRPVQIYCSVDRLTVLSDRNIPDSQITLGPRTADSVDQLVKTVWDHVETWGIAGRGMYWRPTLSIHYAPDGAVRFNELRTLLLGSGLEVVGKPIHVARPIDTPYERR